MQDLRKLPAPAILLRIALAFTFIYPAVSAFFDPYAWIGYFPGFILSLVGNDELLLHAWGVLEIALALWVLFGKRIFIPCLLMAGALAAVVLLNLAQIDVLFRDIPIALAAIAVALINGKKYGTR